MTFSHTLAALIAAAPTPAIIVQRPDPATGAAAQLVLLFHGVGSTPEAMLPVAQRMAAAYPQAFIVSVQSPHRSDLGQGFQWFSVQGIDEDNRKARIADAMPSFVATVRYWQQQSGVDADGTSLIGFSQGAIMALESTQLLAPTDSAGAPMLAAAALENANEEAENQDAEDGAELLDPRDALTLAGRVIAIAGRFASLPRLAPPLTTLHFFHGKADPVIHYGYCVEAAQYLVRIGADLTADIIPFLEHRIDDNVLNLLIKRLQSTIPKRVWDAAQRASAEGTAH